MEEEDVSASGGKGKDSWQGEGRSVVIAGERKEGMEGEVAWGPPPGRGWATPRGSLKPGAKSVDLSSGEVERGNRLLRQSRGWMRKGSQKGSREKMARWVDGAVMRRCLAVMSEVWEAKKGAQKHDAPQNWVV